MNDNADMKQEYGVAGDSYSPGIQLWSDHMKRRSAFLAIGLVLIGCVPNPYAKFYQGIPDARARADYDASPGPVQVYTSNDFNRDVLALMQRGYILVGQSAFNAAMSKVKDSQLRDQADRIGAQIVLVASQYTNTVSGSVPLSLPTTSTTTTTATATATGSGGTATAFGTGPQQRTARKR